MEGLLELRAGVKQLIGKGWVEKDDLWGPLEMKGGAADGALMQS